MPEGSDSEEMSQPEPTSVPDVSGKTPQARPQRERNRPKRFDDYIMGLFMKLIIHSIWLSYIGVTRD